jgi:hypothetical protein
LSTQTCTYVAGAVLPVAGAAAEQEMARPREAGELLDVDVNKLAGACSLMAVGRIEGLEARALAEPDPLQNRGDGRHRHHQRLRDLGLPSLR